MQSSRLIKTSLTHPGTNRRAAVVHLQDLSREALAFVDSKKYVLVVANEFRGQDLTVQAARAWVEAGASYICAWGPEAEGIEEAFDYATFLPELGEPLSFILMTTSHSGETLENALWFAFYNGKLPEEPEGGGCPVVVVVDSRILQSKCIAWVRGNAE
jgi:hypothetical protein